MPSILLHPLTGILDLTWFAWMGVGLSLLSAHAKAIYSKVYLQCGCATLRRFCSIWAIILWCDSLVCHNTNIASTALFVARQLKFHSWEWAARSKETERYILYIVYNIIREHFMRSGKRHSMWKSQIHPAVVIGIYKFSFCWLTPYFFNNRYKVFRAHPTLTQFETIQALKEKYDVSCDIDQYYTIVEMYHFCNTIVLFLLSHLTCTSSLPSSPDSCIWGLPAPLSLSSGIFFSFGEMKISESNYLLQLDIWSDFRHEGDFIDFMVSPTLQPIVEETMRYSR